MHLNLNQAAGLVNYINSNLTNHNSNPHFSLICTDFGYHKTFKFNGFHNYPSEYSTFGMPDDGGTESKNFIDKKMINNIINGNTGPETMEPLFGIDLNDMDEVYQVTANDLIFCDYNSTNKSFSISFKNTNTSDRQKLVLSFLDQNSTLVSIEDMEKLLLTRSKNNIMKI